MDIKLVRILFTAAAITGCFLLVSWVNYSARQRGNGGLLHISSTISTQQSAEGPSCFDLARELEEPYTHRYQRRGAALNSFGDLPRAYWQWPGDISREAFDKAAAKEWPGCVHCVDVVHYKVLGGRLYVGKRARPHFHREVAEEMLQVLLLLYDVPDMEFLLHFGDGCTNGLPVISWNACKQHPDAGFTMPSYSVWMKSLGPQQLQAYHSCLQQRYPADQRRPMAVWRGSTTDTKLGSFNKDNYMQALRIRLHLLARHHPELLDVRLSSLLNCDEFVQGQIRDMGSALKFEDYNRYCAIVDVDGNGWSDRFGQLVNFAAPIIKLASNHTAFFEHLYAPGVQIEQFSTVEELPAIAQKVIADCQAYGSGSRGQVMAQAMQGTTRAMMDHVGIVEAFAYTLHTYKRLSPWPVDAKLDDFNELNMTCCKYANVPPAFAQAVSERLGKAPGSVR